MRSGDLLAFKIKKNSIDKYFFKSTNTQIKKSTHTQIRKYTDIIN